MAMNVDWVCAEVLVAKEMNDGMLEVFGANGSIFLDVNVKPEVCYIVHKQILDKQTAVKILNMDGELGLEMENGNWVMFKHLSFLAVGN